MEHNESFAMARKRSPRPTDAELGILRVLWERGPATVREVFEVLHPITASGYTTILKFLQIMHEKGLVKRNEDQKSHVYTAALKEEETQRQLVRDLLERAFGGSAQKLVLQALSAKKASAKELAEIRQLIEAMQTQSGKSGN